MGFIEKKRGAVMLFSNLSAQDAFYFPHDKNRVPHRYLKFDFPFNYYVDSGIYQAMPDKRKVELVQKRTKKNLEIVFLQTNHA